MLEEQELVQEEIQAEQELEETAPDAEEELEQEEPAQEETQIEQELEEIAPDAEEELEQEEPAQEETQIEQQLEEAAEVEEEMPSEVEEELAPEVEEEPEKQEGRHWYVIHSYSGYENKVRQNLESRIESMGMQDFIFQVVVPTEEVVELRDGRRRNVERRIFPGYILVDMIMTDESWFVVRNTPAVTGFVGSGSQPTPLREEEADAILKRMEEEAPQVKVSFRVGETVRIVDGPFTDFLGTVDSLYLDKGKVRILVSFFGRETPVELDFLQVEKE
jgi:transcriptional antiterminator NusG